MFRTRMSWIGLFALSACLALAATAMPQTGDKKPDAKGEKKKEVWTDPNDPALPMDFKYQGEYSSAITPARTHDPGCQVIALGNGYFQAVFHEGLPGRPNYAGVQGPRYLMEGKLDGDKIALIHVTGKRKYLAQSPSEFVASTKLKLLEEPGKGDTVTISDGVIKHGTTVAFRKIVHASPTLGAKPPDGAIVLFNGTNTDEWNGGRLDKKSGFLNTDGANIKTKRKFNNYTVHVEFMLPFRPDARDQQRGNSGFYQVDQYEVQILDSFGLEGRNNECGGVYTLLAPKVNMCLPPLQWQTYDIDFTNAVREGDKVVKKARLTVKHNGVVIHDDAELKGVTGGARALDKKVNEPEGTPGVLQLQGHGNPLQFKNIWIVEKK